MTREELKEHCLEQIEMCEVSAMCKGEKPSGKVYEEHKLILELLEQEPVLDKIRAEMEQIKEAEYQIYGKGSWRFVGKCLDIIDKYGEKVRERNDN